MASKSPNKARKRTEDKLDWESLETAPNVEGMLSYLRTPAPIVVPFPSRTAGEANSSESPPSESPPINSAITESRGTRQPETALRSHAHTPPPRKPLGSDSLGSGSLHSESLGTSAPEQLPPRMTPTTDVPGLGKRRYHRCVFVQEAHTPGEQAVLTGLYRLGKNPRFGQVLPDGSFRVSVSLVELGRQIAMHETNVRVNIRNLTEKLAIEQVRPEDKKQQSAREYRVYTFKQILERRREAGLEWVVKGRGVRFVSQDEAVKALPSDSLPSDYLFANESLPSEAPGGVGSESLELLGSETLGPIYIGKELGISSRKNTSSTNRVDARLVSLIRSYGLIPDDQLLQRMNDACNMIAEQGTGIQATADEVLYFTNQKLRAIQRMSNVRNPLALLATIVPKCFEGESFQAYREGEQHRLEAEQAATEAQQRELDAVIIAQKRILEDPASSDEDKMLAAKILGL